MRVWPKGCVCQAVRVPGSKVTRAPAIRDGSSTEKSRSTRTEPVKYSACPWVDGCEPVRATVMFCIFLSPSMGWAFAADRIRNETNVLTPPGQSWTMPYGILLLLPERPNGRDHQRA